MRTPNLKLCQIGGQTKAAIPGGFCISPGCVEVRP